MDSAKKSVEKILEIAKKHGYDCVVAFKKPGDAYAGVFDTQIDKLGRESSFAESFRAALEVCREEDKKDGK